MERLKECIDWLAAKPDSIFIGQGLFAGTKLSAAFADVPKERKIEFPVAEDLQLGVSIGLSLEGFVPVSVFPRTNFLLCAMNQLANHLDVIRDYSDYRPKVIVLTQAGLVTPLNPGPQHVVADGYWIEDFAKLFRNVHVRESNGLPTYQAAYEQEDSTVIVE